MKNIYAFLCLWFCLAQTATAQVPGLSSYPTASPVIFLDFDGHTVEGTSWNYGGPIPCDGANLNADQINEIVNRVAEDYRPFNINITTDSTLYWAAPPRQRTRVILTTSSSWYGSAGGVAFTNSFSWGDNTPCFVFTALLKYNVKFIAEAASHEAGHTLGLNHQSAYDAICNKTAEYNAGVGYGEIGWAPIMGVGYYRNQTLWHYGSNPWGCNYMQDDLSIITSNINGFGYRADDYGNGTGSATAVAFSNNNFSINGVIERPNDVDLIRFTMAGKNRFQLSALPFSIGPGDNGANVDLQVELINDTGAISMYNPPSILSAAIDTVLSPGTYYVRVQSTGNAYSPGFASLGSYTLNANIISSTLPVHKLELKAATVDNRHKLQWEIVADENVVAQTVELATNGINFRPVATVAADKREFSTIATASISYYRLKVLFDNGREYYSNVSVLRENETSKPSLLGNVSTGQLVVNSPETYQYAIVDLSGRTVTKGQLTRGRNEIATGVLSSGMYVLRYSNGQAQFAEKFMKR